MIALHHGTSLWSAITVDGGNMVLYYLLLHIFVSIFGDGAFALRMLSALAGAALTPVIFFLTRRMFGSRTAVIAAAIVAASPALVVWDQQARGYGLGTLLIASSLLAALRALERPIRRRWVMYGVLVVLSIYTVVYAALFLVPQWLALAFLPQVRRQVKPMLMVAGVAGLAYVSLIFLLLRSSAASLLSDNPAPSTSGSIRLFEELATGLAPDFFAATTIAAIVTVIALLCWIAAGAELISRIRRAPGELETVSLGIAMSWLILPLLIDPVFSIAYRSIFDASFLLQSVPAGAIVVAFAFGRLLPKGASYVPAVGFVALLVAALVPTYGVSYEQWAGASRYIRGASRLGDCITFSKAHLAENVAYYFFLEGTGELEPRLVLPSWTWPQALDPIFEPPPLNDSFSQVASSCSRLWDVISRATPGELPYIDSEAEWFYRRGFKRVTVQRFMPGFGFGINVALLSRGSSPNRR